MTIQSLVGPAGALKITNSVTIVGEDLNGVSLNITIDALATDPTPTSTLFDEIDGIFGPDFGKVLNIDNDGDGSSVFDIQFGSFNSSITGVEEVIIES